MVTNSNLLTSLQLMQIIERCTLLQLRAYNY